MGGGAPESAGSRLEERSVLRLEAPLTPFVVQAGTVIPAVLETEVNSDFAGGVRARTTRDVFDSRVQQHLLIPKGAVLIGSSGGGARIGQRRLGVAWTRLILPDGRSIALGGLETKDMRGASAVGGTVDNRYWKQYSNAFLVSAVGAGVSVATRDQGTSVFDRPSVGAAIGSGVAREMGSLSTEALRRGMQVGPTITLPAGQPLHVFVQKDMAFEAPYRPADGLFSTWE
jgi:type IV secretion system protein VirB10